MWSWKCENCFLFITGFTEVTECPKSESEVKEASVILRCGNDTRSRYNIHYLLEFCYDGEMGIVDKGKQCSKMNIYM